VSEIEDPVLNYVLKRRADLFAASDSHMRITRASAAARLPALCISRCAKNLVFHSHCATSPALVRTTPPRSCARCARQFQSERARSTKSRRFVMSTSDFRTQTIVRLGRVGGRTSGLQRRIRVRSPPQADHKRQPTDDRFREAPSAVCTVGIGR
jgi:hypothetical protein